MELHQQLFKNHVRFSEQSLKHRQFKHQHIFPLIEKLKHSSLFQVSKAGKSFEDRDIYSIRCGTGPKKILLWSQMHGDEPTATMALFDIFNFINDPGDLNSFRDQLLKEATLVFLPMLNPDGAEVHERRNAQGLDLNREALNLTGPEAKVLKDVHDQFNPDFGFNLHDQSFYYSAGESPNPATISWLAPAYNYPREFNPVRTRAMQVIAEVDRQIQNFIPGCTARYDDAFEPRAFGDNIQKWGTSTILVESGGYPFDYEKQFIRKINFVLLLSAFESIISENYTQRQLSEYEAIPENKSRLFDLLIRNVEFNKNGKRYRTDLGIVQNSIDPVAPDLTLFKGTVDDIGDLHNRYGYQEIDGTKLKLESGKCYQKKIGNWDDLQDFNFRHLLEQGYTELAVKKGLDEVKYNPYPINVHKDFTENINIDLNTPANLLIKSEDKIRYVIVNGFLFDPEKELTSVRNAMLYTN